MLSFRLICMWYAIHVAPIHSFYVHFSCCHFLLCLISSIHWLCAITGSFYSKSFFTHARFPFILGRLFSLLLMIWHRAVGFWSFACMGRRVVIVCRMVVWRCCCMCAYTALRARASGLESLIARFNPSVACALLACFSSACTPHTEGEPPALAPLGGFSVCELTSVPNHPTTISRHVVVTAGARQHRYNTTIDVSASSLGSVPVAPSSSLNHRFNFLQVNAVSGLACCS